MGFLCKGGRRRRVLRLRGAEPLEFTLVLLPLLAMVTVLLDTSWAVFAKATLQRAVRIGVRVGITQTFAQMAQGACLTDTVKGIVQSNSMGLLGSGTGSSGYALIKVHYFQPPTTGSTSAATDVSTQSNGDQSGNIMQVSVQGYSVIALLPRIFTWKTAAGHQSAGDTGSVLRGFDRAGNDHAAAVHRDGALGAWL